MKPAIQFADVNIVFGTRPKTALPLMDEGKSRAEIQQSSGQILGVHNCSLEVQAGEILVLMGLSGSGKSTLLRAANGLNSVVRGSVVVQADGADRQSHCINVTEATVQELRVLRTQLTAMVFQQFALLPWRSVEDNVAFGLELVGMQAAERKVRTGKQLELVQLSDWGHCMPHELSGGMQQRVGLARAFATEAPILLMDEPFSALDPLIRNKLQDDLLILQKQLRRTIIFVSHDLDEALKLGNRIAIMQGGRIVQIGTGEDIILNPADDYVRAFVMHLNPMNVLRAESIMQKLPPSPLPKEASEGQIFIGAETGMRDIIRLMSHNADVKQIFIHAGDQVIGSINIQDLLRHLAS